MTLNDPIANMLSKIENAEKIGIKEVTIYPSSKLMKGILTILHHEHYLGAVEEKATDRGVYLTTHLLGSINKCRAIKPRYAIKKSDYNKFEKRYLPAKNFGIMIISTSEGIMTHEKAKEKKVGGKLLCYCY